MIIMTSTCQHRIARDTFRLLLKQLCAGTRAKHDRRNTIYTLLSRGTGSFIRASIRAINSRSDATNPAIASELGAVLYQLQVDLPCHLLRTNLLLLLILVASRDLYSRSLSDAIDPLPQVWEGFHVFLGETTEFPSRHPRPCLHVCNGVFALSKPCKILAGLASIFTRQSNFEHAVNT